MGCVTLETAGDIAVIRFDNPGKLNAFTRAMRAEAVRLLAEIGGDAQHAGAVLTGAGEAFCAGQDLNEAAQWDENTPWVEEFEAFARGLLSFRKPLVAAVNGVAAGGGFQMALMCDSRIGHPGVRMGQTEVRRGLASVTGTWLLQRSVGDARARELALSARLMDADELHGLGLLNLVVPPEQVLEVALSACRRLAESPAGSFALTKGWLYDSLSDELGQVFADAVRQHRRAFESGISQAGARAFLGGDHRASP
ncbi:enoyl-CoA hydratase/isomerase family protein [Rhodoligotrophos defluvii]|uniref:enoyl-CoA hydratase/isomerase family protein n=1 Tax=Rhodoligotrophos defluvii TaxID=2561934 RepID=UPI001484E311|nr:enoyl-CoA hydratase/isomerase family protein [Rhodoligotrophos defluvii]